MNKRKTMNMSKIMSKKMTKNMSMKKILNMIMSMIKIKRVKINYQKIKPG